MSFEQFDFSTQFQAGFRIDRTALILHLALENRIQDLAERALCSRLMADRLASRFSASDDEVQAAFQRLQVRLDCRGGRPAEALVAACATDLHAIYDALERHVIKHKAVNALVREAVRGDAATQEALCWEAFASGTLRAEVMRSAGVRFAAGAGTDAPDDDQLARARRHLMAKHDEETWHAVTTKLTEDWGLAVDAIERAVGRYARALRWTAGA